MSVESVVINIAFFVVAVVLYKPLRRVIKSTLGAHMDGIKTNIDFILETKAEYNQLLKKILKKNDELDRDVDNIINQAKVVVFQMQENAQKNIDRLVQEKLEYTKRRIEEANDLLVQNVRANCAMIAVDTVKNIIKTKYSNDEDQKRILNYLYGKMQETQ